MNPPASSLAVHSSPQLLAPLVPVTAPLVGAPLVEPPLVTTPLVDTSLVLSASPVSLLPPPLSPGFPGPQATSSATQSPHAAAATGATVSTSAAPQNGQHASARRT